MKKKPSEFRRTEVADSEVDPVTLLCPRSKPASLGADGTASLQKAFGRRRPLSSR